jgi:hypothetical protein
MACGRQVARGALEDTVIIRLCVCPGACGQRVS